MTRGPQVIIIGGGVIGSACAYFLSRRDVPVLMLERETTAAGASGACDGHVTVQTKAPGLHTQLALQSLDLYRDLPDSFRRRAELRPCGSLLAACGDEECRALETLAPARQAAGLDVRLLDGRQARRLEPALTPKLLGATWCPSDMGDHPWHITRWFAGAAQDAGAAVRRGVTVQGVASEGDHARVESAEGSLHAPWVIVASGAWTPQIRGLAALPIRPRRGEILVTERLPRLLNGIVVAASYVARKFSAVERVVASPALEQTSDGTVLIGGTREFAGYDRGVSPHGLTGLARTAVELVPGLATANLIRAFAGLRPWSPDSLPLIGRLEPASRVVIAAGHEGDGITLAPVTGRIVADLICDGHEPDPRLAPGRFMLGAQTQTGE